MTQTNHPKQPHPLIKKKKNRYPAYAISTPSYLPYLSLSPYIKTSILSLPILQDIKKSHLTHTRYKRLAGRARSSFKDSPRGSCIRASLSLSPLSYNTLYTEGTTHSRRRRRSHPRRAREREPRAPERHSPFARRSERSSARVVYSSTCTSQWL